MAPLIACCMALSCFSRIPLPPLDWNARNMRYLMAAFPVVGLIIGLVVWCWLWVSELVGAGPLVRAVVLALIPYAVTGGIHLDGFCDVVDARSSHAGPTRQRQIMSDPHIGAFAVMALIAYVLLAVALCLEVSPAQAPAVSAIFTLSRSLAGILCLRAHPAKAGGMLYTIQSAASRGASHAWLILWALAATAVGCVYHPLVAVLELASVILLGAWVRSMSERAFEGATGDVVGYFISLGELVCLAIVVLVGKAVA